MEGIANQVWWCPRCGTIKLIEQIHTPKLVEHLRNPNRDWTDVEQCLLLPKDRWENLSERERMIRNRPS